MDNGSTYNFLKHTLAKRLGLPQVSSSHTYVISLINGDSNNVWSKAIKGVQLEVQGHVMTLDFYVMHMTRVDMILGHEWLHGLDPSLMHGYQHNTLIFIPMVHMFC